MLTLLKNADLYTPEHKGKKDVLFSETSIIAVEDSIDPGTGSFIETIDASGCYTVPGFIDNHVHITGGGGEGGYASRTPEIMLSSIIDAGITTVIGTLGTDGTTRTMTNLLAKTKGLRDEGISAYCYTGSYQIPEIGRAHV